MKIQAIDFVLRPPKMLKHCFLTLIVIASVVRTGCASAHGMVGVVDRTNKFVIPPKYEYIRYLGQGVFQCYPTWGEHVARFAPVQDPAGLRQAMLETDKRDVAHAELRDRDGRLYTGSAPAAPGNISAASIARKAEELYPKIPTVFSEGLGIYRENSTLEKDKISYSYTINPSTHERWHTTVANPRPWVFGYMNPRHEIVIPAKYYQANEFKDGIALVRLSHDIDLAEYAYINRKGKVISPTFWRTGQFIDDRAKIAQNDDSAVPRTALRGFPPPTRLSEMRRFKRFVPPGGVLEPEHFGRWGLIDRNFRYVIEPKYAGISKLDGGLYLASSLSDAPSIIFDKAGNKVSEVSPGCSYGIALSNGLFFVSSSTYGPSAVLDKAGKIVFRFPPKYDSVTELPGRLFLVTGTRGVSTELPAPTIYNDHWQKVAEFPERATIAKVTDEWIICVAGSGNSIKDWQDGQDLIFADKSGQIQKKIHTCVQRWSQEGDIAIVAQNDHHAPFDFKQVDHGIIDRKSNWIFAPEHADFEIAEPDRFVKTVYQKHFDSNECKAEQGSLGKQFPLLLQDYDLIGMPRAKLIDLIGRPDHTVGDFAIYTLGGFGYFCGNGYSSLEIRFMANQVVAWHYLLGGDSGRFRPWVCVNMVCEPWDITSLHLKFGH